MWKIPKIIGKVLLETWKVSLINTLLAQIGRSDIKKLN